jgi:hypothetical protein
MEAVESPISLGVVCYRYSSLGVDSDSDFLTFTIKQLKAYFLTLLSWE